jgi:hypothetical protein
MIATAGLVLFLLAPLGALPADSEPGAFVVHSLAGVDFTGPLRKLTPDGNVQLGGSQATHISSRDIVTIRRAPLSLPSYPVRAVVLLTHGDRVLFDPDKPLKLEDGRLHFHLRPAAGDEPVGIPRAFIALLWLDNPEGTRDADLLIRRLLEARRTRDVLLLRNGDQLAGTVAAIDPVKGVRMDANGREVTVALAQVSGIAFNTELQVRLRRPKAYAHVILANGGRLTFSSMQLDAGAVQVEGKTLFGARLAIPLAAVAALEPRSERIAHLSDLKPKSFEHTPFLGASWPLANDTAVAGHPLLLGGNTFDKGLGMHSRSRVTYALDGRYRWFESLVGLDDRAGPRARVRLRVVVDGKQQNPDWERELTGKDSPVPLRIDIMKARELTLMVDFGAYGDVKAHVDWADARLVR